MVWANVAAEYRRLFVRVVAAHRTRALQAVVPVRREHLEVAPSAIVDFG
jgi:hypothetical protein